MGSFHRECVNNSAVNQGESLVYHSLYCTPTLHERAASATPFAPSNLGTISTAIPLLTPSITYPVCRDSSEGQSWVLLHIGAALLATATLMLTPSFSYAAEPMQISGPARVVDGDTLEVQHIS